MSTPDSSWLMRALFSPASAQDLMPAVAPDVSPTAILQVFRQFWPKMMREIETNIRQGILSRYRAANLPNALSEYHESRELAFWDMAQLRAANRMEDSLRAAMLLPPAERVVRLRQIVQREKYYNKLYIQAAQRRTSRVIEHVILRQADPRSDDHGGAFWVMDWTKKTHTIDCLAMQGKCWSWRVLRFRNPANRHPGCGCRLAAHISPPEPQDPPDVVLPGWDIGQIEPQIVRMLTPTQLIGPASYRELLP